MAEIWLRTNQRFYELIALAGAILLGASLLWLTFEAAPLWQAVNGLTGCSGLALVGFAGLRIKQPRIAYRSGEVLFYLQDRGAIAVPLPVVEAFFLGQGPAMLPWSRCDSQEVVNLVARLSQNQSEWADREVSPALGRWNQGYITIRGTWCEPLTGDVIRRLNRRLREVSEEM